MQRPMVNNILACIIASLVASTCHAQGFGGFWSRGIDLDSGLLSHRELQRELKISRQQRTLLEAVGKDLRVQRMPFPERRKAISKFRAIVLDKQQQTRLAEIRLQFEGLYAVERIEFAEELDLTLEELEAIRELRLRSHNLQAAKSIISTSKLEAWQAKLGEPYRFGGAIREMQLAYYESRRQFDRRKGRNRRRRPENE